MRRVTKLMLELCADCARLSNPERDDLASRLAQFGASCQRLACGPGETKTLHTVNPDQQVRRMQTILYREGWGCFNSKPLIAKFTAAPMAGGARGYWTRDGGYASFEPLKRWRSYREAMQ